MICSVCSQLISPLLSFCARLLPIPCIGFIVTQFNLHTAKIQLSFIYPLGLTMTVIVPDSQSFPPHLAQVWNTFLGCSLVSMISVLCCAIEIRSQSIFILDTLFSPLWSHILDLSTITSTNTLLPFLGKEYWLTNIGPVNFSPQDCYFSSCLGFNNSGSLCPAPFFTTTYPCLRNSFWNILLWKEMGDQKGNGRKRWMWRKTKKNERFKWT